MLLYCCTGSLYLVMGSLFLISDCDHNGECQVDAANNSLPWPCGRLQRRYHHKEPSPDSSPASKVALLQQPRTYNICTYHIILERAGLLLLNSDTFSYGGLEFAKRALQRRPRVAPHMDRLFCRPQLQARKEAQLSVRQKSVFD